METNCRQIVSQLIFGFTTERQRIKISANVIFQIEFWFVNIRIVSKLLATLFRINEILLKSDEAKCKSNDFFIVTASHFTVVT